MPDTRSPNIPGFRPPARRPQTRFPAGFRGPELREAAILVQPEPAGPETALEVGPTCRICPRTACPARREPSILRG